jgi:hypothetical protein
MQQSEASFKLWRSLSFTVNIALVRSMLCTADASCDIRRNTSACVQHSIMLRLLTCIQATASRMPHLKAAIGAPNDQLEPSSYILPLRSGCHLCIPRSAVKLACACFLITGSVTYSVRTVQRAVQGV